MSVQIIIILGKMKKSILNLGKALNKVEQKNVNGGGTRGWKKCISDKSKVSECYASGGSFNYDNCSCSH
ncbi:hypothetical protein [Tenacibaculum salmonis]|uniref:hypothetical protein n=1 Tax=Tenacibaculum sp. P3-BQ1 TaxID=3232310 RepID=UPI0034DECE0F